jgi:hypothetical protein
MTHYRDLTTQKPSQAYSSRTASAPEQRARQLWHEELMWTVYERVHGDGESRSVRLVFDNGAMIRTCRSFPADWASLSDGELFLLSLDW